MNKTIKRYYKRRTKRLDARGFDAEEKEPHVNHGNTRLPYGIAKGKGIDTEGMTPKEVWKALQGEGVSASNEYKKLENQSTNSGGKYNIKKSNNGFTAPLPKEHVFKPEHYGTSSGDIPHAPFPKESILKPMHYTETALAEASKGKQNYKPGGAKVKNIEMVEPAESEKVSTRKSKAPEKIDRRLKPITYDVYKNTQSVYIQIKNECDKTKKLKKIYDKKYSGKSLEEIGKIRDDFRSKVDKLNDEIQSLEGKGREWDMYPLLTKKAPIERKYDEAKEIYDKFKQYGEGLGVQEWEDAVDRNRKLLEKAQKKYDLWKKQHGIK